MACRLFGVKPLREPILVYYQLDVWEQVSVKFKSQFYHFRSWNCAWKCRLPKWRRFCSGWDELAPTHELHLNGYQAALKPKTVSQNMHLFVKWFWNKIRFVLFSSVLQELIEHWYGYSFLLWFQWVFKWIALMYSNVGWITKPPQINVRCDLSMS